MIFNVRMIFKILCIFLKTLSLEHIYTLITNILIKTNVLFSEADDEVASVAATDFLGWKNTYKFVFLFFFNDILQTLYTWKKNYKNLNR